MIFCCCPSLLHHCYIDLYTPTIIQNNLDSYVYGEDSHTKRSVLFLSREKKLFNFSDSYSYYVPEFSRPCRIERKIAPAYFDFKGLFRGTGYYGTPWEFDGNEEIFSQKFFRFMSIDYFVNNPASYNLPGYSYSGFDCYHYMSILSRVDFPYSNVSAELDGRLRLTLLDSSYIYLD